MRGGRGRRSDVAPATTAALDDAAVERTSDVAIDFTSPDAVLTNVPALARRGINVVLGTTGWQAARGASCAQAVADAGIGIVAAPNFSTGVVLFEAMVAPSRRSCSRAQPEFGAWLHEAHHATKKDAPSGTALKLKRTMEEAGYTRADRRLVHARRLHSRHPYRSVSTDRPNRLR